MRRWQVLSTLLTASCLAQETFVVYSVPSPDQETEEEDLTHLLPEQVKAMWQCRKKAVHQSKKSNEGHVTCSVAFDGWSCWNETPAGQTAKVPCPDYIADVNKTQVATRQCLPNGTWAQSPYNNKGSREEVQCNITRALVYNDYLLLSIFRLLDSLSINPYREKDTEEEFRKCIEKVLSLPEPQDGRLYCPRTFDGWSCWNDTLAGHTAYISCPNFIPGFVTSKFAYRICEEDGNWYRRPDTNKTWSNYTTCIDHEDLAFRQKINNLYIAGYSVSLVALLLSLATFFYFRSLKCTRIDIHKNLFLSFIINNITWIVWYTEVVQKPVALLNNERSCQALHIVVHYFLVSNYFWMFCEGLYLHTVLVFAFIREEHLMKWFYVIGWGIPLILIAIYASLRSMSDSHRAVFWLEDSEHKWILSGPVCISMLLNLIFLINIVRVLITKLRAVNSPDTNQTRKAVRATLILIPLLGLHYLLTPFRPAPKAPGEAIYETLSAVVTSLQGFTVSLLFCFLNGEVIAAVRRKWNLTRLTRDTGKRTSYAATSVSVSYLISGKKPFRVRKPIFSGCPDILSSLSIEDGRTIKSNSSDDQVDISRAWTLHDLATISTCGSRNLTPCRRVERLRVH